MRGIEYSTTANGETPCRSWISCQEVLVQAKIDAYIKRVAMGAAKKNVRTLGDGVFEIKIDHGPGYRIYFGEVGRTMILLLMGGDQGSQFRDIRKAKDYWSEYVSK